MSEALAADPVERGKLCEPLIVIVGNIPYSSYLYFLCPLQLVQVQPVERRNICCIFADSLSLCWRLFRLFLQPLSYLPVAAGSTARDSTNNLLSSLQLFFSHRSLCLLRPDGCHVSHCSCSCFLFSSVICLCPRGTASSPATMEMSCPALSGTSTGVPSTNSGWDDLLMLSGKAGCHLLHLHERMAKSPKRFKSVKDQGVCRHSLINTALHLTWKQFENLK